MGGICRIFNIGLESEQSQWHYAVPAWKILFRESQNNPGIQVGAVDHGNKK